MNEIHYRKLERMYSHANVNTMIFDTTTCEISEGLAEIGLDISDKYFHALGAMHGAVYFKLLDDACFFALSSLIEDFFLVTTSFNINFVRPVNSGRVKAVGKIKFKSRQVFVAESILYNEEGKEVAFGTGNFTKSKIMLTEDIGYKL